MQTFVSILTVKVFHPFYKNGRSSDLTFEPSPETQRLINGHRLQIRFGPAGFQLFAPIQDNAFFLALPSPMKLEWYVWGKSPLFWHITHLPKKDSKGSFLISNEESNADFLTYGGIEEKQIDRSTNPHSQREVGTYSIQKYVQSVEGLNKNEPLKLIVPRNTPKQIADATSYIQKVPLTYRATVDSVIGDFTFTGLTDIDLDLADSRYSLEATPQSPPLTADVEITASYQTSARPKPGVFASLQITCEPEETKQAQINLQFKSAQQIWRYLIVSNTAIAFGSGPIKLTIAGISDEYEFTKTDSPTVSTATDELEKRSIEQLPVRSGSDILYLLKSDVPIPFHEQPILTLTCDAGAYSPLPAPMPDHPSIPILFDPIFS